MAETTTTARGFCTCERDFPTSTQLHPPAGAKWHYLCERPTLAAAAAEPKPCACWSCDSQCGGTDHPGWCGPTVDVDGRPICEACRERAQVFDNERQGVKVTISGETVRVEPDTFGSRAASLWLGARSARHLAAVLVEHAAQLEGGQS